MSASLPDIIETLLRRKLSTAEIFDGFWFNLQPITDAEITAGVTPINYAYPQGYVLRYANNTTPGTTDMTAAHTAAAAVAKLANCSVVLGVNCKVTSTIDFSQVRVVGPGAADPTTAVYNIVAGSSQFDVITSAGQSVFENFSVHGGWDLATAGQSGDVFTVTNPGGTGFAYNVHFRNIRIEAAKKRMIYINKGGYSSLFAVRGVDAGLHGLELFGSGSSAETTTISVGGESVFSGTPNGYGAKITECTSIGFKDVIMELTKGILIAGIDNRSLSFDNVYQEGTIGGKYIDLSTGGSGIGLSVTNSYGGGSAIDDVSNWQSCHFQCNSNLGEPAIPYIDDVYQADSGQLTTSSSGADLTAGSISLGPGIWMISATLQTLTSTASTMTQAACCLTTNVAATGLANSTNSSFVRGAAQENYNPGASLDQRLNCYTLERFTATTTFYHRARFTFGGAGNLTYRSFISAVKVR